MKEYIERANFMNGLTCSEMQAKIKSGTGAEAYSTVLAIVNCLAAADVVEVVRCKDCVHGAIFRGMYDLEYVHCDINESCLYAPDGFCSYGERRVENAVD